MNLTIAKLARAADVGVETVRYYQRRNLLETPERGNAGSGGGVRRYGEADLRRLRFVRAAQAAGFTLDEIGELIRLDATDDRARARALANRRIAALDARIAELQQARRSLQRLARRCAAPTEGACPIIEAFNEA